MEPELYEYENNLKEDYSQDEWYYQNPHYLGNPVENKTEEYIAGYDEDDEYDMQEEPDWFFGEDKYDDGDYYEPKNEI